MDWVLDLDLDFFVWPVKRDRPVRKRLPRNSWTHLATPSDVRSFLEERCHLKRDAKTRGRQLTEHSEAFETWREWLGAQKLSRPFGVVHVDGHSDLGAGVNNSFQYLDGLLALPLERRSKPGMGPKAINSGNYLLAAIANRWLAHLTYVYPTDPTCLQGPFPPGDLPHQVFLNGDWRSKQIQLRGFGKGAVLLRNPVPVVVERRLSFDLIAHSDFEFSGFTHLVVAHSPRYTPESADPLLPVIQEYFHSA
jgi:hypothetical protein